MQEGYDPTKYYLDVKMALFAEIVTEDITLTI